MRNPQICWDKIFPGDRETLRQMIREQAAGGTSRELLYRILQNNLKSVHSFLYLCFVSNPLLQISF